MRAPKTDWAKYEAQPQKEPSSYWGIAMVLAIIIAGLTLVAMNSQSGVFDTPTQSSHAND